jgi:hypothetical protein
MRLVFAVIAGWFVLALGVTLAAADPVSVQIVPPGTEAQTGQPWTANVIIARYGRPVAGRAPVVRIRQGGETREVRATPTGHDGVYRVRLVFPVPGRWNYEVPYGRTVDRGTVTVR